MFSQGSDGIPEASEAAENEVLEVSPGEFQTTEAKTEEEPNSEATLPETENAKEEPALTEATEPQISKPQEIMENGENSDSSEKLVLVEETDSAQKPRVVTLRATMGPLLMLNLDDDNGKKSAPSPVTFSAGVGAAFFDSKPIFAELRLAFFMNYYLWDGEKAQPAEIENRTATVLSFMLDITGGYSLKKGNNIFEFNAGLGLLLRFGFLSNGVKESDYGWTGNASTSNAGDDVDSINSWLMDGTNLLCPEVSFTYFRKVSDTMKFGGEARVYFPVGSIGRGDGFDGMMISISAKAGF